MRIESDTNYETIDWPTRDEGRGFLKTLGERGILAADFDDVESRMKLFQLGLVMPKGHEHWLLFDSTPEKALYVFFRLAIPGRNRMRSRLIVFRFDLAKYRSNPLAPEFGVGGTAALFCRSIAIVAGLDYSKGMLGRQAGELN